MLSWQPQKLRCPLSKKSALFLFVLIAVPLIIYLLRPSDENRIRKIFKEGSRAVEKKDLAAVMSKVSFNYRDEHGFTYLYIKETLKTLFQRMDNIKIEYENLKININDKTAAAEMDVRIIATVGNDTGYIMGDMPHPVHLKFTLDKERTKWLVSKTEGLPIAH
jgi:hypothetical protein